MKRWLWLILLLVLAPAVVPAQAQNIWSCQYRFSNGLQGWNIIYGTLLQGNYVESVFTGNREQVEISLPAAAELYEIRLYFENSATVDMQFKDGSTPFDSASFNSGSQIVQWSASHTINAGTLGIRIADQSAGTNGYINITQVYVAGFGASPCQYPGVPRPTPIAIDGDGLNEALMSGNASLADLPSSLGSGIPNETGAQLFGYAKWIFSPSSADEIAGPFAPTISHAGIGFSLIFGMALIYGIVWAAVWLIRFAIFVFRLILEFIQTVVSVIGSVLRFFI